MNDWERARTFYRDTLDLPIAAEIQGVGWIEYGFPNETHLAISKWEGSEPMPPTIGGATAAFGCDAVRETIERLRDKGVRCDDVRGIPGMVILGTFYDPDGNRLQIAQSLS